MALIEPGTPADLAARVTVSFQAAHRRPAAVVGRAPGRVNLIGEHTDYNAGLCLPLALPHATYAAVAPREDGEVNLISAQSDQPWHGSLSAIGPGQGHGWAAYAAGVLWAMQEDGLDVPGVDIAVDSTVPLGAGLSSSAAIECAVAVAVAHLAGVELDGPTRRRLVAACIRAESEVAGAPTGGMDQTVSMLATEGDALLIDFADHSTRDVPVPLETSGLVLLVTDTRVSHSLTDGGYASRRADCEAAAELLGVGSLREADLAMVQGLSDPRLRRRATHIVTEIARVEEVVAAFSGSDWDSVGRSFAASHASMRDDFEISCAELDVAVATAVEAGALAARMTGGGFGGSSVAIVPEERLAAVIRAIDTAFVAEGFRAPAHLRAVPVGRAGVLDAGPVRSS
jgi:galactokinase